jgi:Ca-activated chloride channel family protein
MNPRICPTVACGLLALQALSSAQQRTPFRTTTEAVLVDVQVREGAKPVPGLTTADFELRDNGVLQQIKAVTFDDVPVSLMLLLDTSNSVQGETLQHLKRAAQAAIAPLGRNDQAALIAFSERIRLQTGWTRDQRALGTAMTSLESSGATALFDAIYTALGLRNEAAGRTLVVIFSDGADTASWLDPTVVVEAARQTDVVLYGVTVRPTLSAASSEAAAILAQMKVSMKRWFDTNPRLFPQVFLDHVTEETGGEMLYINQSRDLTDTFSRIIGDFKSRYLLTYSPAGVPAAGWHSITVKLKGVHARTATVTARRGYSR